MQLFTYIAIYFVVWWMCLFLVLPFGARTQADEGAYIQGTDPGAPAKPQIWRKLLWTTILSIPFTALLMWLLSSEWLIRYWS
jgi:predicted secreted protein